MRRAACRRTCRSTSTRRATPCRWIASRSSATTSAMPALSLRARLDPLRAVLSGGAERARRVITPDLDVATESELGSAGSLLQETFVRRLERLNVLTRGLVRQGLAGEHRSRRHASSAEFADFRKYVPGDDFRRIDWNAYARLDGLFLKQTEAK